jgi:hypothetical protein
MSTKFKQGDFVVYNGESCEVVVAQKNFSTKKIIYLLNTGVKVGEEELEGSSDKGSNDSIDLLEQFKKVFGKEVPTKKKKDLEWVKAEIETQLAAIEQAKAESAEEPYKVLKALSRAALEKFIIEKELEIYPDDFSDEDLLVAVCQELGVEIPN